MESAKWVAGNFQRREYKDYQRREYKDYMKAFVTGGTGFIGSHLVDLLLADESTEEVRCLVRSREKWLEGKPYQRITGDLMDRDALDKGLEGIDTVFHVAGMVKAPSQGELNEANVAATELLIRRAEAAGVGKMVILSSLAAVGPSNGHPHREEAEMKPVSMYGKSKMLMEQMIHDLDLPDLSITIIRPPAVYGPREDQIYTWFRMFNNRISAIVGDGKKPEISLVYVSDLVRAIRLAAEHRQPGINTCFITGPEIYNWEQIRKITSHILGKQALPLYVRPGLVRKLGGFVESAASLIGVYPVLNRDKANELALEWTCSGERAAEELGFRPTVSLEEGLSRTLHWYQQHDWL